MDWLRCQKLPLYCLNFDFKIWFGPVHLPGLKRNGPEAPVG